MLPASNLNYFDIYNYLTNCFGLICSYVDKIDALYSLFFVYIKTWNPIKIIEFQD